MSGYNKPLFLLVEGFAIVVHFVFITHLWRFPLLHALVIHFFVVSALVIQSNGNDCFCTEDNGGIFKMGNCTAADGAFRDDK